MSPNEKSALWALVSDVLGYYRQPVSDFTLQVWWTACQPFTMEQVSKALTQHATDPDKGQFAPKVADLVRILAGTKTDRSLMAWGRVYEAMSDVGAYRDVDFADDAIHAAIVDMGGWPKICRSDLKELSFLQHRFCESYKAYQAAGVVNTPPLIGDRCSDDLYKKRGLPVPEPVRIGGGKSLPRVDLVALMHSRPAHELGAP